MSQRVVSTALPVGLRDSVLERLGLSALTSGLPGLQAVCKAWCAQVPFDNLRKMIALLTAAGGPLPGADARISSPTG